MNSASNARAGEPDFSVHGAISDILFFIPGVTTSLVTYLVFGTAKSWTQYRDLVVGGCGLRKKIREHRGKPPSIGDNSRGFEFERLPTLPNRQSDDSAVKEREVMSRVRMFSSDSKYTLPNTLDINKPLPVARANTNVSGTSQYFHKPVLVDVVNTTDFPTRSNSNSKSTSDHAESLSNGTSSIKQSNSIRISNRYSPDLVHISQGIQPDKELGEGFKSRGLHSQNSQDFLSDSSD